MHGGHGKPRDIDEKTWIVYKRECVFVVTIELFSPFLPFVYYYRSYVPGYGETIIIC